MTIAEQIKALMETLKTKNVELTAKMAELEANPTSELMTEIDGLSNDVEVTTKSIATLEKAEKIKAGTVATTKAVKANVAVVTVEKPVEKSAVADFIVKSAVVMLDAKAKGENVEAVIESRYGKDEFVKSAKSFLTTKGAQNPAMTSDAAWAGALVQEGFGAFMDLIQPSSVVANLPLARYSFDGYNSLKIPKRVSSATKNLAGAFVGEGNAIRVGAAQLGSITLTPKKLAVIGTFTAEIMEQSTPNIETLIRKFILDDTAVALDTAFLGAAAGTAVAPAGIANGVTAVKATGATVDKVDVDLGLALDKIEKSVINGDMVWIMSNSNKRKLSQLRVATGDRAYSELSAGTLMGKAVVSSTTVADDKIYLIDCSSVGIAGGVPSFLVSNTSTLHEEDTTPLAIVDGAAKTANPVRSLYQTDAYAIRMIEPMDWAKLRDECVYIIDSVSL